MKTCAKCGGRAVILVVEGQGRNIAWRGCRSCGRVWRERWPTTEAIEEAMRLAIAEAEKGEA